MLFIELSHSFAQVLDDFFVFRFISFLIGGLFVVLIDVISIAVTSFQHSGFHGLPSFRNLEAKRGFIFVLFIHLLLKLLLQEVSKFANSIIQTLKRITLLSFKYNESNLCPRIPFIQCRRKRDAVSDDSDIYLR